MSLDRKILSHLIDPASIERVSDMGVRPEIFEEPIAGNVFAFILEYWRSSQMSKAPTAYVLEQQFPGFRVEPADTEEDAGWLAEAMMKRYATNNVQQMCMAAATTANTDPLGTLKMLTAATYEASQTIAPRHSRSDMFNIDERRLRYQKATEGTGRGITLGLSELDDHTNGLLPGELCAVGAFSKVGKTMFLVNAAAKARYAGYQPILFSLEMPIAEIEDRMDAMLSGVSYSKLTHHKLHLADLEKLHATQDLVREMGPIRIESPEEGERTVSHLCARARHTGSDLLIIDQLSFMEETRNYPSEKQRQGSILKQLKNEIGRDSRGKLPCLLAVQLRRESLDRKDGPELRDFADAAEVERTCDLLMSLSRNKHQRLNRLMKLDIMGARRSDTAAWMLRWDLVDHTLIDHMPDGRIVEGITGG